MSSYVAISECNTVGLLESTWSRELKFTAYHRANPLLARYRLPAMGRRTSVWLTVRRCGWRRRRRFWSTLRESSPWWILSLSKRSSRPPFHTWWNAYPRTMPYRYWCCSFNSLQNWIDRVTLLVFLRLFLSAKYIDRWYDMFNPLIDCSKFLPG